MSGSALAAKKAGKAAAAAPAQSPAPKANAARKPVSLPAGLAWSATERLFSFRMPGKDYPPSRSQSPSVESKGGASSPPLSESDSDTKGPLSDSAPAAAAVGVAAPAAAAAAAAAAAPAATGKGRKRLREFKGEQQVVPGSSMNDGEDGNAEQNPGAAGGKAKKQRSEGVSLAWVEWVPPVGEAEFELPAEIRNYDINSAPAPFVRLTRCRYSEFAEAPRKLHPSEVEVCSCKPDSGCGSDCELRALMIECSKGCPCGDKCMNRRIAQRQYCPSKLLKTVDRGWGLALTADVPEDSLVAEYVGEIIDQAESTRRVEAAHAKGEHNFYLFQVSPDHVIDAGPMGNIARFVNHSCGPNCHTEKWAVGSETRVGIFTSKPLPKGTELTYNYFFADAPDAENECRCGAEECSGFMGKRPLKLTGKAAPTGSKKSGGSKTPKPNEATATAANAVSTASAQRTKSARK